MYLRCFFFFIFWTHYFSSSSFSFFISHLFIQAFFLSFFLFFSVWLSLWRAGWCRDGGGGDMHGVRGGGCVPDGQRDGGQWRVGDDGGLRGRADGGAGDAGDAARVSLSFSLFAADVCCVWLGFVALLLDFLFFFVAVLTVLFRGLLAVIG